jgi:hypothetical protein
VQFGDDFVDSFSDVLEEGLLQVGDVAEELRDGLDAKF